MILETIRSVTDALNSSLYGVNVQLTSMSYDTGDTLPPQIVSIVDETRNNEVAVGRYPTTFPGLIVTQHGTVSMAGEVYNYDYRDGEVTVMIRYIISEADSAYANSSTLYTIRAIEMCLRQFLLNTNESDRIRNGIQIISCTKLEQVEVFENINDAFITGGIRATFYVRDTQP